jgi:hypothetical protein
VRISVNQVHCVGGEDGWPTCAWRNAENQAKLLAHFLFVFMCSKVAVGHRT